MNKNRKTSHILNVFQYDHTTGIIGLNGAPVSGYGLYTRTDINDGSVGIDSSASINALYLLKNTTKQFEISYDTSGATKIFRLLPYQSGSFFQIGNPSNAANSNSDYVFISEAVYGNVLIGPGITNATGNLTGATASIHKVQFNGAVFANNFIQATSFKITGGSSTGFLKADGTVDTVTYLSGNQSITVSGDATGSGTTSIALTLANTAVTPGTYGSTTLVPVVTVDSKGRITSVTTAAISGSLTFTGDVTGTGTTGTSTAMTLAASGVTAGTYTKVTVDTKGRVTVGANASTTDISEGTNLYYTDTRARAAISVTGSGSYNSSTGVITVTGGVTSVNTLTGAVVLTTTNIAEGTNLYYTDARVGTYLTTNSYATQTYVGTQIANLVASSPATLDTLNELAAALGNDPSFATTVATSIGTKQAQLNGTGFVKISGTTISYDNSTYLTTGTASSTYVPYTGATADLVLGANNFSSKRVSVLKSSDGYGGFTSNYLFLQTGSSTTNVGTDGISLFSKPNTRALVINYDIGGTNYGATLDAALLTASRTFEFPNASGVLALTSNIPTNNNQITNGAGYTTNTGTVTSVSGTGTVSGLSLSGTVTTSGNLTLGGTLTLTSGNVTTALGFTPYNATNPSGYISSYTETDTLSSVVARGSSTTAAISAANFQIGYQVLNLDSVKTPGLYHYDGAYTGTQPLSYPWANVRTIEIGNSTRASQFVMPYSADRIFYRRNIDSGWQSYVELYHTGNIPTWNQNTTGTAAYATQWGTSAGYANFSSTAISASVGWLFGTTGNGTYAPVSLASVSSLLNLSGTNTGDQTNISGNAATATNVAYSGLTGTVPTWNQNTTGNAATVTNATFYRQFTVRDDRSDGGDYNLSGRATGLYAISSAGTNGPGHGYLSLIHVANATDVAFQIAGGYNSDAMYFRGTTALQNGTGYSTWRTVIHSGNIGSQTVATAGALSSMNISQFTNNSGYITGVTNISGNAGTVTNGVYTTGDQTIGGIKTFGKRTYFGSSSGWDDGSLNGENANITNLHFQGHADFWIGAGNGTWYTTATAGDHDLIINTMHGQSSYNRGISFTASLSGTSGYKLGKWYSGTSAATSYLSISGGLVVGGTTTFTSIKGAAQTVPNTYGAYLHLGDWAVARTAAGAVLVNTAYRADYATDLFDMNISRFTNNSGYITSSGILITIQDTAPTGVVGKLWWESDTGKLKVYYGSAWVDASPIPDVSLYYSKAGGVITGDVSIGQTLNVVGNTLVQGTISAFGDIIAYSSSDSRLKDNITIIESPLEKLSKINGVSFNWNDKQSAYEVGKKDIGVIAQEIEEVLPELVTTRDNGYKAVRYEKIVALLIEAVKEQQTQINNLTDKLNNL
jgi:hypothetical protein